MSVTERRLKSDEALAIGASLLGAHHVRFHRDAGADHYLRDCLDHLWSPQVTRAGPLARKEPRRIQEGLERAPQHARRRDPYRGTESEGRTSQGSRAADG